MSFNVIRENKILAKISEFTVPHPGAQPCHDKTKKMSGAITAPILLAVRRLRPVWASVQSDQSLRYLLSGKLRTKAFFVRTAQSHFLFSHVAA